MTESCIRLYHAVTNIDDSIIEEAQSAVPAKQAGHAKGRLVAAAAVLCAVLAGALLFGKLLPDPAEREALQAPPTSSVRDYSPIRYGDLSLAAAQAHSDLSAISDGSLLDIKAFDESCLKDCCGILEGTITRMDSRHYTYDYYDDKFGPAELYHGFMDSVVYELSIEKVWYGETFASGSTILVEDPFYFPDLHFALSEGRTYVIPIFEYGNMMNPPTNNDITNGDLSRDSVYSTVYPFHPQILKTEDGNYLVTTDWATLAAEPCREVIMENDSDSLGDYHDRVRLVFGDAFAERLTQVIRAQTGSTR